MGRRRKSSIFPPRSSSVEYPQEDDYSFYRDHLDKQTELGRRRIGDGIDGYDFWLQCVIRTTTENGRAI